MIDPEDEEFYKQCTSINVEFDNQNHTVSNLSRRSTVIEVLHQVLNEENLQEDKWVFIEIWRGTERPLPPRTRILRVWHAWCSEQRHVGFRIQRATANQTRFYHHPKKRRRPIVKSQEKHADSWSDSDSISSDTSDSLEEESLNTSDTSTDEDSIHFTSKDGVVQRVTQQSVQLEHLSKIEKDLDEKIRSLEGHIQMFLLQISIQDYKDKTKFLEEQLSSTKYEIANLESTVRIENTTGQGGNNLLEEERKRLELEIEKQIRINDRLEMEASELSNERSLLETSVNAREELLSKCCFSNAIYSEHSSDSEFYRSNHLDLSLDEACSISGKPIQHIPIKSPAIISAGLPVYRNEADSDADDEGTEDCGNSGRLSSHDSYEVTNHVDSNSPTSCSQRDSQAPQCYSCPDCLRLKQRQSGSSDSGNVSDDSKITSESLSSDGSDSATDSAISSTPSQEKILYCESQTEKCQNVPNTQKPSLWKSESTDNDSDVFTSREVYAKQLRKNSKIFRSSSAKAFDSSPSRSSEPKFLLSRSFDTRLKEPLILYKQELIQMDDLNEKIIETLV